MSRLVLSMIACSLLFVQPALAQSGKQAILHTVPQSKIYLVPIAKLMRVDEGVFELEIDKTIDLTNNKILLSISMRRHRRRPAECCELHISGERVNRWKVGSRIDLKKFNSTRNAVSDKTDCFLDIVDIATPKGVRGVATFRLHCV